MPSGSWLDSWSGSYVGVLARPRTRRSRVQRHDRAVDALEAGHRGLLHGRVEGEDDVAAGGVAAGEQVGDPAQDQPVVGAGEQPFSARSIPVAP